jgi:hypothetical protein
MEPISAAAARDHIEMVDRILAQSHQRLCAGGEYFVVWGVASAFITVLYQLVNAQRLPAVALWLVPAALILAAVFSVVRRSITRRALQGSSLVQREFFNVLYLAVGIAFIADVAAFRIFSGFASAAIWSVAESIVLLYIGMHGNRRAQIGGVILIVSLVVANFVAPSVTGYVLALGMLAGYAGFGLTELLTRD